MRWQRSDGLLMMASGAAAPSSSVPLVKGANRPSKVAPVCSEAIISRAVYDTIGIGISFASQRRFMRLLPLAAFVPISSFERRE